MVIGCQSKVNAPPPMIFMATFEPAFLTMLIWDVSALRAMIVMTGKIQ